MSNKELIIFGINKFAELIKYYIEESSNIKVAAFTVDREYITKKNLCGLNVIPFEDLDKIYSRETTLILPAIGYRNMNNIRKKVFSAIKEKGYKMTSYIHPTANIANNSVIGIGNIILENSLVQPFVNIGDGNIIWSNVNISHHSSVGNFNYFAPGVSLSGEIKIGDNCFLGNGCIAKNGIQISDYTLIGAAAYVSQDTLEYSVIVPYKSKVLSNKRSIDIRIEWLIPFNQK